MPLGKKTLTGDGLRALFEANGILLWDYQGTWGLVATSQLAEWLRSLGLFKRQKTHYPRMALKAPTIDFRSTIPVPDRIARVLRSQYTRQKLGETGSGPQTPASS